MKGRKMMGRRIEYKGWGKGELDVEDGKEGMKMRGERGIG